jgi:hypothetical protein
MNLGAYLTDISYVKSGIIDQDGATDDYSPYIINEVLSRFSDCIFHVNAVNRYPNMNKKAHFKYLMYSLRSRKRFDVFDKPVIHPDFEVVQEYYNYSYEKTLEALKILTPDNIEIIKQRSDPGKVQYNV